jgi:predicted secreted protein
MSVEYGSLMLLKVGANTVVGGRAASLSLKRTLIETTSKDSEWTKRIVGRKEWSISAEMLNDLDDITGQHAIREAMIGGTSLSMSLAKATPVTGDRSFSGTVQVTNVGETAPDNDAATFSVEAEGTGALTITVT